MIIEPLAVGILKHLKQIEMKQFTINIHPKLKDVTFTVKNGRKFSENIIKGNYQHFDINVLEEDRQRVFDFAKTNGNDNANNGGNWYAHCNGFAMDLCVTNAGKYISINTWRPHGRSNPY